jgi:hypothetical protein
MTLPAGAFYEDGAYWKQDGTGPYAYDGTNLVLITNTTSNGGSGAITGIGRNAGGMILNYTDITTNTTTVIKAGMTLYGGMIVLAPGTAWTVSAYDNIAALGNLVVPLATAISGTGAKLAADCCPVGTGIILTTGLTIVTAGTTPGVLRILWA